MLCMSDVRNYEISEKIVVKLSISIEESVLYINCFSCSFSYELADLDAMELKVVHTSTVSVWNKLFSNR